MNLTTNDLLWGFGFADINKDGYPDLSIGYRQHNYLYFYNPRNHLFDTTE